MPENSHRHNDRGRRSEDYIRRKHDLEECPEDWCDAINPRTGSRHEVKTCLPGKRFRLWEDNHRSLAAAHGQNAAWYYFVVVTKSGNVVREKRMKAPTVTRLVNERGGWNKSGHRRGSRQLKIPESEIF